MKSIFCFVKTNYSLLGACSRYCERLTYLHFAGVIQLVECQLPKLDVVGSSPIARSLEVVDLEGVPVAGIRVGPGDFLRDPFRDPFAC